MPSLSRQQLSSTPTAAANTADPTAAAVARNQIQQRHFVDAMLLEADRAVNRKVQILVLNLTSLNMAGVYLNHAKT